MTPKTSKAVFHGSFVLALRGVGRCCCSMMLRMSRNTSTKQAAKIAQQTHGDVTAKKVAKPCDNKISSQFRNSLYLSFLDCCSAEDMSASSTGVRPLSARCKVAPTVRRSKTRLRHHKLTLGLTSWRTLEKTSLKDTKFASCHDKSRKQSSFQHSISEPNKYR